MANLTSDFSNTFLLDIVGDLAHGPLTAEQSLSIATSAYDRAESWSFVPPAMRSSTILSGTYANGDAATIIGSNLLSTFTSVGNYPFPPIRYQSIEYAFADGGPIVNLTGDWRRAYADYPFMGDVTHGEVSWSGGRVSFTGVRSSTTDRFGYHGFDGEPAVGAGKISAIRFDTDFASVTYDGRFVADTEDVGGFLQSTIGGTVTSITVVFESMEMKLSGVELAAGDVLHASISSVLALALEGDDVFTGSHAGDVLWGFGGNDTLMGGDGADTIDGGAGDDSLVGGLGTDFMLGLGGDDTFVLESADDTVVELEGDGFDEVRLAFTSSGSYALADNVEKGTFAGAAGVRVSLTGNALDNVLAGGSGADTLDGALGNDTLAGGNGDDLYYVGDAGDSVTETATGGYDTIVATAAEFSLANAVNVETLRFGGTGDFTGWGNALANSLGGGQGADTLEGGAGLDLLRGHAGMDILQGGEGNDILAGGADADSLVGGAGSDMLIGGEGDDVLAGGAGYDTLVGSDGDDTLSGGAGVDRFVLNSLIGIDEITDFASGTDKIAINRSIFTDATAGSGARTVEGLGGAFAYDLASGELRYDADGLGGADAAVVVKLTPGMVLAADFLVIG